MWNDEKQSLFTNVNSAMKKASDSDSSMKMFKKRGEALKFVDSLKGNKPRVVTPNTVGKTTEDKTSTEKGESESKMSAKDLTEMFNRGIINKSGNKILVNYITLTGKNAIVVVIDVCRETKNKEGVTVRIVSK